MICTKKGRWQVIEGPMTGLIHNLGPVYGEIVWVSQSPAYKDCFIVMGYERHTNGQPRNLLKNKFVPLMDISELEAILKSESVPA